MKPNVIKALIAIACIIIALGLTLAVLMNFIPDLIDVIKNGNEEAIEDYVRSCGTLKGAIVMLLMFAVHFISIFIPCVQVQIAAGAVYGLFLGQLLCLICITICGTAVYVIASTLGKKVDSFVDKGQKEKSSKLEKIIGKDNPGLMLIIACFIPLFPQASIPYFALKTKIPVYKFALIEFFGNIPITFMMNLIGSLLVTSGVYASLIMAIITVILSVIIWWQRNNIVKFFLWIYRKFTEKLKKA